MRICKWCGTRIHWPWQHCRPCRFAMGDAGIYLQSGGPPFAYMSRLPKPPELDDDRESPEPDDDPDAGYYDWHARG